MRPRSRTRCASLNQQVRSAARFQDLSDAIVLHDVRVDIIKDTVCTKSDVSGGMVALGAVEAAAYLKCVEESDGQVSLGYKAASLATLVSSALTHLARASGDVTVQV